tara:strand:+ start:3298 stop:3474 length:177 start_codon:yes stop_codon:yes gene_type:complete
MKSLTFIGIFTISFIVGILISKLISGHYLPVTNEIWIFRIYTDLIISVMFYNQIQNEK